jgi:hypothetical protein
MSSGETLRFDKSIYPAILQSASRLPKTGRRHRMLPTLLLVNSEDNDDLIAADSDELLNTSDTSSGQFGEKDHAIDVVVFEELYVGTHFCDLFRYQSVRIRHLKAVKRSTCLTFTMTKLSISGNFSS